MLQSVVMRARTCKNSNILLSVILYLKPEGDRQRWLIILRLEHKWHEMVSTDSGQSTIRISQYNVPKLNEAFTHKEQQRLLPHPLPIALLIVSTQAQHSFLCHRRFHCPLLGNKLHLFTFLDHSTKDSEEQKLRT